MMPYCISPNLKIFSPWQRKAADHDIWAAETNELWNCCLFRLIGNWFDQLSATTSSLMPSALFLSHQALWPHAVRAASAILGVASASFSRSSTTSSKLPTTTRGLNLPLPINPTVLTWTLQPAGRGQAKQRAKHWSPRGQSASVKLQVRPWYYTLEHWRSYWRLPSQFML